MKRRSSIVKAEYGKARADGYQERCNEIIYHKGIKLRIDGLDVYLDADAEESLLFKVTNPKVVWYEIWLKLREM